MYDTRKLQKVNDDPDVFKGKQDFEGRHEGRFVVKEAVPEAVAFGGKGGNHIRVSRCKNKESWQ